MKRLQQQQQKYSPEDERKPDVSYCVRKMNINVYS